MKTRTKAGMLALTAALALGACSKAPAATVDANGTSVPTEQSSVPQTDPSTSVQEPGTPQVNAAASVNVQTKVPQLQVFAEPSAAAKVVTTLKDKTSLGSKTTLLVLDKQADFLQVSLPTRPNGSTGWVKASDVQTRTNDYAVSVDLGSRKLTVTKAGAPVLETPVAVGADKTPTAKGTFYITDFLKSDAKGSYGPFAFGLSGHSDALTEFAGGDGQLGIHGTNDPSSIGKNVSNGCVRLPNDVITKLANMTPLGTPVTIA